MAKKHHHFRFKQFSIDHSRSTMKVGTDGVLLGAWVNVSGSKNILDIGTGSGVIALMLAQRSESNSHIDAVEIDPADASLAIENVRNSPWPDKVTVHDTSIQNFRPTRKYDLIVSNPPFFSNSFEPPDSRRLETRHTISLSFEELINHANRLLAPNGRFSVVLPVTEASQFISLGEKYWLCSRKWWFKTRADKPAERLLLEFATTSEFEETGEILLYKNGEEWSDDYKNLTRDFYLKA